MARKENVTAWELISNLVTKGCKVSLKPVDTGVQCSISHGQISSKHVASSLLEAVRGAIENLHNGDLFDWLGSGIGNAECGMGNGFR